MGGRGKRKEVVRGGTKHRVVVRHENGEILPSSGQPLLQTGDAADEAEKFRPSELLNRLDNILVMA